MGDKENDSHKHDCDGKNNHDGYYHFGIGPLSIIIDEEINHHRGSSHNDRILHQHDDGKSPQCTPPAIAEELAVGDVHKDQAEHEFYSAVPITKEAQEESLST